MDMVIGAADNYTWTQLRNWVNSLNSCGFKGRKVMLAYRMTDELEETLTTRGIEVIRPTTDAFCRPLDHMSRVKDGAPNTISHEIRFFHAWQLLMENDKDIDNVILTDSRDVIFQSNPSVWLDTWGGSFIIIPSEGIKFNDEPWNARVVQQSFGPFVWEYLIKHRDACNVGTIAGPANLMRGFLILLYNLTRGCAYPADQTSMNLMASIGDLLSDKLRQVGHNQGWACQCGTTVDPQKIQEFRPHLTSSPPVFKEDGYVYTSTGDEYVLVHQYDRVPEWNAIIDKRYNY